MKNQSYITGDNSIITIVLTQSNMYGGPQDIPFSLPGKSKLILNNIHGNHNFLLECRSVLFNLPFIPVFENRKEKS